MHVPLKITTSMEYFNETSRELDCWDEGDNTKIPLKQADEIDKILACEVSIYLLRRATGIDGGSADNMGRIRRDFINKYEETYEPYVEYNDFW